MTQQWQDLLFIHFPLAPEILRPLIPAQIELDTFDGQAWIGIVPFRVSRTNLHWLPSPFLSPFPEINVRTYVTRQGIPGVYFFSLDAANLLAVIGARLLFHLPYFFAQMSCRQHQEAFYYHSMRTGSWKPSQSFAAYDGVYRPNGPIFFAEHGTLEYWLVERYYLYTVTKNKRVYRVDIQHGPWPLQLAEQTSKRNTMALAQGIVLPDQPPLLHYAGLQDVLFWPLHRVG
jgi:uncharacterized protein YqjF (DUF2071 family)